MSNLTLYVRPGNEAVFAAARQHAEAHGLSLSQVIAEALRDHLRKSESNDERRAA